MRSKVDRYCKVDLKIKKDEIEQDETRLIKVDQDETRLN